MFESYALSQTDKALMDFLLEMKANCKSRTRNFKKYLASKPNRNTSSRQKPILMRCFYAVIRITSNNQTLGRLTRSRPRLSLRVKKVKKSCCKSNLRLSTSNCSLDYQHHASKWKILELRLENLIMVISIAE